MTTNLAHSKILARSLKGFECSFFCQISFQGACEGTLSCSTCHLIFDPDEFAKLGLPEPDDEELDMLDLAYGLTPT